MTYNQQQIVVVTLVLGLGLPLVYGKYIHQEVCEQEGGRLTRHDGCVYPDNRSQDTLSFWVDRWTKD